MTWRRRHKDGHWIWLEGVATNLIDDPSVGAIVTNYRDVTERLAHEATLSEQLRRLALLSRITHAIGERQDLRSILRSSAARLEEELPVDFCCIFARDAADNRLTVSCIGARSAAAAANLGLTHDSAVPIDENGLARCVRGQLVYEPEIAHGASSAFPQLLASAGLGAMVIAPLLVESQVFGVLVCARQAAQSFSSGECEFLRQVSEHTALAAHQAQLYRRAATRLRRPAPDAATGHAAGTAARAGPDGQRHRARHQQRHLAGRAVHRGADRARAQHLSHARRAQQLEIIQRAVDDVAQTVARMGEFYRAREPQLSLVPVDLNKLVKQVVDLTRARWSDMVQQRGVAIDVRLDLAADLPAITAVREPGARCAGEPGLQCRRRHAEWRTAHAAHAHARRASGSRSVQLEVIDAGIGMDEETRRRCLEPFFTTKGTRGTGLGLAMVYGVAQRHGAGLEIESEPGQGTAVRMSFAAASEPAVTGSGSHRPPVGPLRMLLIDDDPLLLKSLRDTLESEGHEVRSARMAARPASMPSSRRMRRGQAIPAGDHRPRHAACGWPQGGRHHQVRRALDGGAHADRLGTTGWSAEGELPPHVDQVLSKPPKVADLRAAFANYFPSASRA